MAASAAGSWSGVGSLAVSTLPFTVSGISDTAVMVAGTMCSGRTSRSRRRTSVTEPDGRSTT